MGDFIFVISIMFLVGCLIYLLGRPILDFFIPYKFYGKRDMKVISNKIIKGRDYDEKVIYHYYVKLNFLDITVDLPVDYELFNKCLKKEVENLPVMLYSKKEKYSGVVLTDSVRAYINSLDASQNIEKAIYKKYLMLDKLAELVIVLAIIIIFIIGGIILALT